MVTRISTAVSLDAIVQRMLDQQQNVNDLQKQVSTGLKSQDYVGISQDASRLLNIKNEHDRIQNYVNNNDAVATTLNVQLTAAQSADDTARTIRSALLEFTNTDLSSGSPDAQARVSDIQQKAFNALSQIAYILNQKVDGRYVFGGGQTDKPPINFPYSSLDQFQQTYDGINNVFPSSRVANLVNLTFSGQAVTYSPVTVAGSNYTQITGPSANSFVTQTLGSTAFGSMVFSNVGSNGKITATNPGAFKSLQVGQTILINNTDPGQGGTTGNNGVYTITSVSPDGSSITLDQSVNAGTEPAGGATIGLAIPNGTTMALSGSGAGNNGAYTIHWPTNAQLTAAGYNLAGGQLVDGSSIFVDPQVVSTAGETISLKSTAFLTGSNLTTLQKISDTQSIKMDVTALDPAFEKLIRGLGMLCQGDLLKNPSRATQALTTINDSIEHSALEPTEASSDLQSVQDRLSLNLKQLADTKTEQNQFLTFLANRADDIDKADPTETAVRLNSESQSLQISYATLARIQKLSLLDYL